MPNSRKGIITTSNDHELVITGTTGTDLSAATVMIRMPVRLEPDKDNKSITVKLPFIPEGLVEIAVTTLKDGIVTDCYHVEKGEVRIPGTRFIGAEKAMITIPKIEIKLPRSKESITVTLPAGVPAGPKEITVTLKGDSDIYTYDPPIVTKVDPSTGPIAGGIGVTITGIKLSGATAVAFDGTVATDIKIYSDMKITATLPPHAAGDVHVSVTTSDGTSPTTDANQFTYKAATEKY